MPVGKKKTPSLREMEKQIQADMFDHIISNGGNLTVYDLVEKYVSTKTGVRPTTRAGYNTVLNLLRKDPFGAKRIDTVRISDAKVWLIRLQQEQGKSYSSIHTIRGVVRPAFQMAVDDDLIRKNPFGFQLVDVIVNDSVRREAVSREEERKVLKFVKEDKHFSNYYEGIYILFKTGLRISEFCGLTLADIDLENHTLNIDHQLLKRGSTGYYIQETKTTSGTRVLPMTPDIEECFRRIIEKRNPPKVEPMVDGHSGFLYFDKDGSIMYFLHWEHYFKHIVEKYNKIYKIQMPKITPHVCRHTYCSNMAKSGMNPKTLQYLMGHSDIGVTLNTYTHLGFEDAKEEVLRLQKVM
jgi:integrase